jgi:hypothetical protein
MALVDDIAAIRADQNKSEDQKRRDIYALKNLALVDVILNGKLAPNPIPPLINRDFTVDGKTVRVLAAQEVEKNGTPVLYVALTVNGNTHQVTITNPPILPKQITGNEKQDLIQAAVEILAQIPA